MAQEEIVSIHVLFLRVEVREDITGLDFSLHMRMSGFDNIVSPRKFGQEEIIWIHI